MFELSMLFILFSCVVNAPYKKIHAMLTRDFQALFSSKFSNLEKQPTPSLTLFTFSDKYQRMMEQKTGTRNTGSTSREKILQKIVHTQLSGWFRK